MSFSKLKFNKDVGDKENKPDLGVDGAIKQNIFFISVGSGKAMSKNYGEGRRSTRIAKLFSFDEFKFPNFSA